MRQGQNNSKRSRGRGRKPQHSANRAYDSNGPDVKIRGTAAHICEKYQQLARDAISAGDRVTAENYYQHAEHYYRLLMAAQQGQEGQQRQQTSLGYRPDEDEETDQDYTSSDGPQPRHPGQPWHQQGGQNGAQNGAANGNGQPNGHANGEGEAAASSEEDGDDNAEANARGEQGEGEAQPRRRNNRRRRPRGEGARAEQAPAESNAAD
ncbi:DUF4167 domain-containing protein [Parvibaculum sp.]|jgi:hypothetical protein|uniref:DUF4167 domain-containing protein n=1 Tax=Parvibaculum sp. TaxID=2024848 RepID=UPI000C3E1456|nr:DUF4167 domain-containing protein [Parvibaculum sp.]MAU60738.1 hypothetical protein [Parvibaculum sp.]MBO6669092.1 DUF4167 domain-containing protein [Parvibaculum sp.]MBO6692998.1 DUF4167 domain-containing protein [Parvibaculum sp.]MBO6715772.1 DUF4167 domain-containing protein [Parvibaculum sp.]|tara:strand:- start:2217 stop:2840 length:624 start_codon:yes stop_codon:yes gene_type:complete